MSKSDNKIKKQNIIKEDTTSEWESTAASPTALYIANFQLCGTTSAELKTAQLACHITENCSLLFPLTVAYYWSWTDTRQLGIANPEFLTSCEAAANNVSGQQLLLPLNW